MQVYYHVPIGRAISPTGKAVTITAAKRQGITMALNQYLQSFDNIISFTNSTIVVKTNYFN